MQAVEGGTDNLNYVASIKERSLNIGAAGGAFRGGSTDPMPHADFEQSYDAVNGVTGQTGSTAWTVSEGDTLQSIALQAWGDSSLWYKIAEANGLPPRLVRLSGGAAVRRPAARARAGPCRRAGGPDGAR